MVIDTKEIIKKLKIRYFFIFLILTTCTYFVLNFIQKDNRKNYLNQTTLTYSKAYDTIYTQYKELSEVIFTGFLKLAKIDYKLDGIENKTKFEKDVIRQELFLQTLQRFNILKSKNIVNINYILPDESIFLKMKDPIDYGQKISDKRYIIKETKKKQKEANSFEIGLYGSGFRFVYPVIKNNRYLGAVSITFSETSISSSLMKQYNVLCNLILNADNFDKKVLRDDDRYAPSHIDGFLHSNLVLKELEKVSNKKLSEINPYIKISKDIYSKANKKVPQSFFIEELNTIITTIPIIHTITKKQEGFISILSQDEAIGLLDNNYFTILALIVFLYMAIILLFLQQKIKTLIDKNTMQQMMQKDKQLIEQAKMAQMGEMIGNIAHQWRQPLSAISTVASGMKLNYEYNLLKEEDIPANMDLIVKNAQYLSETIDTFRDFIKEDKEENEILIQERIDESLKIVRASIEDHHIKLINEIDYDNPILIKIIVGEFSQVIINLLNNAKDAIVQKDIKDGWIKISQKTIDDKLIISVEDNAEGIKEDYISKIFDPYFTTKHQFQGTGLGLYMSKTIIEKHLNGTLEVSNTEHGALFTITLNIGKREIDSK